MASIDILCISSRTTTDGMKKDDKRKKNKKKKNKIIEDEDEGEWEEVKGGIPLVMVSSSLSYDHQILG